MFGVSHFCAIINPPQSCILAVGGTQKRVVVDPDSEKGLVLSFLKGSEIYINGFYLNFQIQRK